MQLILRTLTARARWTGWLVAVSAAATVAGCSSDAPASSTSAAPSIPPITVLPTPSSSVTVTSTGTPWESSEALTQYRSIMADTQKALADLSRQSPDTPAKDVRTAVQAVADTSRSAGQRLQAGRWAAAVRPEINTLIAALLEQADFFEIVAARSSLDAMRADSEKIAQTLLVTQAVTSGAESALSLKRR